MPAWISVMHPLNRGEGISPFRLPPGPTGLHALSIALCGLIGCAWAPAGAAPGEAELDQPELCEPGTVELERSVTLGPELAQGGVADHGPLRLAS